MSIIYELNQCGTSSYMIEKMPFYMIHICGLFDHYELNECVSSSLLLEKIIFHMSHICGLFDLYELN